MMAAIAKVIAEAQDIEGVMQVTDDGICRSLWFGSKYEQGACLKSDPALLLFDYTQAMMLGVAFQVPHKVLCLGMGMGSMVTALHQHVAGVKITAVERRPKVLELAQTYFYLPQSKRIHLHIGDAAEFVSQPGERYDLILSDLYTSEGLSPLQLHRDFVYQCAQRLKPDGWLVINFWSRNQNYDRFLALLRPLFIQVRVCLTKDGNWVIFAGQTPLAKSNKALQESAHQWSKTLGFSLQKYLKQMAVL